MNLNDFVVIPSNKAKSVKLNARNLRELRMETVTLAQESRDMEERLLQLKESMSREKEERGRSGAFRWKSGQVGALTSLGSKANQENGLHKLSAGKVKIRVLKDQPLTEPPRGVQKPAAPLLSGDHLSTRKSRLTGKICGQCEARTAGLMCAECGEDYCVGCFAKFHQKGALKLHRMIPIQMEIQTSVSALDVVSSFKRQTQADSPPRAAAPPLSSRFVERGADSGQGRRPMVTQTQHTPHSQTSSSSSFSSRR
ncbi:zinc finger B-box domain-containing protein 1 [Aplochiton taeniatus]